MKNKRYFFTGICIVVFFLILAAAAPWITSYSPSEIVGSSFMKPCKEHFLGTNDIGQDIFSEIVYGTRYSLLIGFLAAMLSWLIGSVVGIVSVWL